jgi:two-component system, sensor histidine kinase and response regulator
VNSSSLKPKILVVDDQPINVHLLKRMLERENMEVRTAQSGQECLDQVEQETPDVILLDVMMPGMDGIEVCQRLKQSEDFKAIPIIFISARSSKEGRLEGLDSGAVDYITKPIDLDETLARIRTQLRFLEINRQNIELQTRLGEARRVATIGAITRGLAHNLNNLLGVAVGYVDLIKTFYDQPAMVQKNTAMLDRAVMRIVDLVKQVSYVALENHVPTSPIALRELLENAVARYQQDYQVNVPIEIVADEAALIKTNPEVMEDAIARVLINAWESYGDRPENERRIVLTGKLADGHGKRELLVTVEDNGRGIDPSIRDSVFEPFTSSKRTVGTGMGLTVARHCLRNLGGQMQLDDRPGGGTRATMRHDV